MGVASYWGELATEPIIEWAQRAGVAGLAGDLCVDGAIGSRTASLREPYADARPAAPVTCPSSRSPIT